MEKNSNEVVMSSFFTIASTASEADYVGLKAELLGKCKDKPEAVQAFFTAVFTMLDRVRITAN